MGSKVDGRSGIFASTVKWTNKQCHEHNPLKTRRYQTLKRFKLNAAQFNIPQNGKPDIPEDGYGENEDLQLQRRQKLVDPSSVGYDDFEF